MRNIGVIIAVIMVFFPNISEAESQALGKIFSGVVSEEVGTQADLTRIQLRDCMLSQRKLNGKTKTIEQINSKLKLAKAEINKRSSYIEKKRLQAKSLSNKQIERLNNTIDKQKIAIASFNKNVDSLQAKVAKYKKANDLFNTACSGKSYENSDMESVIAEIGKEKPKIKKVEVEPNSKKNEILEKYSLTVNTTPTTALVKIMNIAPKYEHGMQLKPGKYDISVTHSNYREYRKLVTIKNTNLTINIVLEK